MPGDSPQQAVDAFLEPIQRAVACLGPGKIVVSPGGRHAPNVIHAWTLCPTEGMPLRGLGTLTATMNYEIVAVDPARHEGGRWRVSTRSYAYTLTLADGTEDWAMHWHPVGYSPVTTPHFHFRQRRPRGHFASERHTFEMAVRWCIELGATPARPDWDVVLAETEAIHRLWRTWIDRPGSS